MISPVPQPLPLQIRQSTPTLGTSAKKKLVVGLPGAVAGSGKVHVKDRASGASVVVPAAAPGTFSAVLDGEPVDLEARYENQDGLSEPVSLMVQAGTKGGPQLQRSLVYGDPVSSPDAQGQVTVTNDAGAAGTYFSATANSDVLVSNANNGAAVDSKTDDKGLFVVKLPGAKGDVIHVLLVDPANMAATSDFLTYTVP